MEKCLALIDKLENERMLEKHEFVFLIENRSDEISEYLFKKAREICRKIYGTDVYIRGLIEFTNYCRNDCFYCGIRCGNANADRYRLTEKQIIECCRIGYKLGFRTFVLQGGEDGFYSDEIIIEIISMIKQEFPDCALTLSIGEKSCGSYQKYFDAGADRYLLRHETADDIHYGRLHPKALSSENRKQCLFNLKRIGYQTGSGFMVGSPYQTAENLAEDMIFLKELDPHMVGIGPFIPHKDTPFAKERAGTLELTLFMLGLLRLMLPNALLPATTALGTIATDGRERGILAGANVVMPNLSPVSERKKYSLYDNKICMGDEAAECRQCLEKRINSIGYRIVTGRGDYQNRPVRNLSDRSDIERK